MDRYVTKWLVFGKLDLPKRETQFWQVVSIKGPSLGIIRWFGRWRCYAFFPDEDTVFNGECLKDIETFIRKLMDERKLEQKKSQKNKGEK